MGNIINTATHHHRHHHMGNGQDWRPWTGEVEVELAEVPDWAIKTHFLGVECNFNRLQMLQLIPLLRPADGKLRPMFQMGAAR